MAKANKDDQALFVVGGTDLVTADFADELLDAADQDVPGAAGQYLKFTKTGDWQFGADETEIDDDDVVAVDPASFVVGWQGWEDGVPVDGPVMPYTQRSKLPAKNDLNPLSPGDMNGWSQMAGCQLKLISDGTQLVYNATSKGGRDFIRDLVKTIALGIKSHPGEPVALIHLTSGSYKHKTYGKIHTPSFEVVGWANGAGEENKKLRAQ